jgi:acyl-CoA reductase-like NAD-dependent aldehyde dehydrogenase
VYHGQLASVNEGSCPPFSDQDHACTVRRQPLGVCALITPWNHPLLIAVKKVAVALATGNTVVVKPPELAPVSVLELGRILKEAGLPDGVYNVVSTLSLSMSVSLSLSG